MAANAAEGGRASYWANHQGRKLQVRAHTSNITLHDELCNQNMNTIAFVYFLPVLVLSLLAMISINYKQIACRYTSADVKRIVEEKKRAKGVAHNVVAERELLHREKVKAESEGDTTAADDWARKLVELEVEMVQYDKIACWNVTASNEIHCFNRQCHLFSSLNSFSQCNC